VQYLGASTRYGVRVGEDARLAVIQQNDPSMTGPAARPGESVRLGFDRKAIQVMPGSSGGPGAPQ